MITFQEFLELTESSTGEKRVSSKSRRERNSKPSAVMSRIERGESQKSVTGKIHSAASVRPSSKFYDAIAADVYKRSVRNDRYRTKISGADQRSRNVTIARSAAKKAGFKGGDAKNRFDYDDQGKYHTTYPKDKYPDDFKHPKNNTQVDTEINTYASGRKAAAVTSGGKRPEPVKRSSKSEPRQSRVPSTDEITRKMKEFRRRVVTTGGDTRNPVHKVDFIPRRDDNGNFGELDKDSRKIGRNFIKAQINLPKELEKAGAQKKDIVGGEPSHMRRGENPQRGKKRREKMYQKIFGNRVKGLDPTGRVRGMIGSVGGISRTLT